MQRRRGIIPTDIDGFIDYGGKVFVYFEAKLIGAPVRRGQRLALENEYRWRVPIVEQYTVVQFLEWWETYCEKLGYIL